MVSICRSMRSRRLSAELVDGTAALRFGEAFERGNIELGFDLIGEAVSRLNPFGMITLNEVFNNEERQGDFEQQISLINAYNTLQSDRVNDKEQFVKAILLISGQILGDTEEEEREKDNP